MPMNLHLSIPAFHQSGRQAFHSLLRKKAIGSAYSLSQGGPEGQHHAVPPLPTTYRSCNLRQQRDYQETSKRGYQRCNPKK